MAERELVALLLLPLMACNCKYSVSVSCGDVPFFAVCDCGIPWTYSLTFWEQTQITSYFEGIISLNYLRMLTIKPHNHVSTMT